MELVGLEVRLVNLELVHDLRTGIGIHARRPVVLVRLETTEAVGWGECEALAEPTYTSEYAKGAFDVIAEHLAPRLLTGGAAVASTEVALERLVDVRGNEMARAGIEMALLDAELRAQGVSLATRLGATRFAISGGATIGLGTVDDVLAEVEAAASRGYLQVKVKITPPDGARVLGAMRARYSDLVICADANGTYDRHRDAAELEALGKVGLTALEQPLAPDDLVGLAALVSAGLPVVLDESVVTRADLERAIAARACVGVAIKPARVGGLLAAKALAERCAVAGIACGLGGMLEAGIGRAAALALGACAEFTLPSDLGASDRYFVPDLTEPHVLREGCLVVPDGPGIGIEVDLGRVEARTVAVRDVRSE
jgi:o-succinylbenzoate synthase